MSEPDYEGISPDALQGHLWARLQASATGRDPAFRIATFCTLDSDGYPAARSIVLRQVDAASREIRFHTDRRSPKVQQIRNGPRAALVFWDASSKTQIRCRGRVMVEFDTPIARDMIAQSAKSLAVYRSRLAPSIAIESPDEAEMAAEPLLENLAVVRLGVESLEWLWLDEGGHRRCRFDYAGAAVKHQWLVP